MAYLAMEETRTVCLVCIEETIVDRSREVGELFEMNSEVVVAIEGELCDCCETISE